jgi:hypothetical protein
MAKTKNPPRPKNPSVGPGNISGTVTDILKGRSSKKGNASKVKSRKMKVGK